MNGKFFLSALLAALWLYGLADKLYDNDLILTYVVASLVVVLIVAVLRAIGRAIKAVR